MDRHTQFTCIMNEMIHYYSSSVRRVNHFLKVWAFTRQIALCEHVSEDTRFILEITALMHDIGIKPSEEKISVFGRPVSGTGRTRGCPSHPGKIRVFHCPDGADLLSDRPSPYLHGH